ncbi:MAG: Cof-type HAD-IIB family hydrolase [Clostridiales bacterium]|nr:Cof-type HAD-IIB family hydrolase [Clostridiales bacterium]
MQTEFSKIKCIAFDLDDTVLNHEKELSGYTAEVFGKARERGIALVPVSGRAFASFPAAIRELEGVTYSVVSNGAAVYDARKGERIHQWLLNAADVRKIMSSLGHLFMEGQISYEAVVDGVAHAAADYVREPSRFGIPRDVVSYIQKTRRPERFIIDFIYENAKNLDALDVILKDSGLFRMVENTIRRNVEQIHITSSVSFRLELSNAAAGKTAGLAYVLEQLQISPEETIAFGDGENDAGMLKSVGIGVAMKNASASCKENAAYVTEYTADEDGAAKFLAENLL